MTLALTVLAVGPLLAGAWLRPSLTRALLRDLRVPRVLHYVVLTLLGAALAVRSTSGEVTGALLTQLAWLAVSLAYAAVFAIVTNNLEDLEADRLSNPERPLVRGVVEPRSYLWAGVTCLGVAVGLAGLISRAAGVGVATLSLIYFVYSCRPLRLKRVPILSKLLLGLNALVAAVTGFALVASWPTFPLGWAVYLVGPLALAANFVDLKDVAGDTVQGVRTLPVVLGLEPARRLIAGATVLAYATAAMLLELRWLLPASAGLAAAHVALLFQTPYREGPIFGVYVTGLFVAAGLVLL